MPLETATYISDLNPSNPAHTDNLSAIDSHLRMIKQTLKATFPNVNGAVAATDEDLSGTVGLMGDGVLTVKAPASGSSIGGSTVLKGAGTNADVTIVNDSGTLKVKVGTTTVLTVDGSGNLTATAAVNGATIKQASNALLPAGCIIQWSGSVASIPAGWALCNGSNGTPDLRDKFVVGAGGTRSPSATGGAASVAITTSSDGVHAHAGGTGSSGPFGLTASTSVDGAHSHTGLTTGHALTVSELPPHTHDQTIGIGNGGGGVTSWSANSLGDAVAPMGLSTGSSGSGVAHSHPIPSDGSHGHTVTVSNAPAHSHSISSDGGHTHTASVATLPPFYALCFIMKT